MLGVVREQADQRVTLLDFGCGVSQLYERILKRGLSNIEYSGLDVSPAFLARAREKFPGIKYYEIDVLADDTSLGQFDYAVISGLFTCKLTASFETTLERLNRLLEIVFGHVRVGLAFNVMSKQVEWERDDLFHLPFETLARVLCSDISRHFVIRHDYGLYEYTTTCTGNQSSGCRKGRSSGPNGRRIVIGFLLVTVRETMIGSLTRLPDPAFPRRSDRLSPRLRAVGSAR